MHKKWLIVLSITCLVGVAFFISNTNIANTAEKDPLIIAHRGASGHEPEHTIEAYKLAQKMKSDYIEIDLHMSKDGQLVAIHDYALHRTTNGTGYVKNKTVKQLQTLDAGSWFSSKRKGAYIPTLDEIFATFGNDIRYYIETKSPHEYPGMEKKLMALLDKYTINKQQLIIQSFSDESLRTFHHLEPSIMLIQLVSYRQGLLTSHQLKNIHRYADGIGSSSKTLTKSYIKMVQSYGLDIHAYTVNDTKEMKKLIQWDVNGIFTNYPDRLYKVVHPYEKPLFTFNFPV
ncbi:glycerophosphodiester phosphodiesterase family protein [Priestia flexa]|uniref:glycerophosphodiester phosphodiesterase family protein n=1 Tax=Priestia flexa TaxID=86664 RepID=UPI00209D5EE5|nr:glycerophosphodiester phosphodiesterase family protein [Priestia flexa]MCP1190033.1 glycerophosphodiester phosphodiesterase [Priestia flexa]